MVNKPKAADYEPGPDEIALAQQGVDKLNFFENSGMQNLLVKQLQTVSDMDYSSTLKGAANADVTQALQNRTDMAIARNFMGTVDMTIASAKTQVEANKTALDTLTQTQSSALGNAYGTASTQTDYLKKSMQIQGSGILTRAANIEKVGTAKAAMIQEGIKAGARVASMGIGSTAKARAVTGDKNLPFGLYDFEPTGTGSGIRAFNRFGV
tara:strand:- start:5243 stop:5872 length:630 start_codon:yes stop_codon:yes gene_type:complete